GRVGRPHEARRWRSEWHSRRLSPWMGLLAGWAEAGVAMGDGNPERALAALGEIREEAERQGLRLDATCAALDAGIVLARAGPPGASEGLREAGALAEELGALNEQRRAAQALRS